tara:strand:- start:813 stop:1397 length:585 start_codon:yes stop_codon:yes gene_type:complete
MILDYPWVEVYLPDTIKEITEDCIKRSRREIIQDYEKQFGELDTHLATLMALWNTAMDGKDFKKQHIQGIILLTEILIWEQNRLGLDANTKRIKAIKPDYIGEELVRRNLEWFDVYEIHERDKYAFNEFTIKQFFNGGKKRPSFEVTTYITKFIIEFDNKLLKLPKDKGKRWDIDEWRRTANIKVKQSWEEERD